MQQLTFATSAAGLFMAIIFLAAARLISMAARSANRCSKTMGRIISVSLREIR